MDADWEMVDTLEAMKSEGNQLFQQARFAEAVEVYTSILDKLAQVGVREDEQAARRLEAAVRLNRAWAWIQMPSRGDGRDEGKGTLSSAEQDCSAVIEQDATCVKAFYRRALARERLGQWKRLEPANPSVGPLLERLESRSRDEEKLAQALRHCGLSDSSTLDGGASAAANKAFALKEEAERAWCALQAEEAKLREVYEPSAKRTVATKGKSIKARKAKATMAKGINIKAEISEKTDDVWASLRQEEEATVARAFSHSKRNRHELALEAS
ncbi:hypothetical protein BBJ28_00000625 [Nothophytophthora sp. Chile5]|nr:hypothetical protein BBJ28_00000625 [Nothophytophthora sp. Chile5]